MAWEQWFSSGEVELGRRRFLEAAAKGGIGTAALSFLANCDGLPSVQQASAAPIEPTPTLHRTYLPRVGDAAVDVIGPGLFGQRRLIVGDAPVADHPSLSAAFASIKDASATNQYQILVVGNISESVRINAKSHIHITGLAGASVSVSTDSGPGFYFSGLTDTIWRGLRLVRAGAVRTSRCDVVYINGNTDSSVRIEDCELTNLVTGSGTGTTDPGAQSNGLYVINSATPRIINCKVTGGCGGQHSYGLMVGSSAAPLLMGCEFIGGALGIGCHGASIADTAMPLFISCKFQGGGRSTDTVCYGVKTLTTCRPRFENCSIRGGPGAMCHGFLADYGSAPTLDRCRCEGGNGANSSGLFLNGTGEVSVTGSTLVANAASDCVYIAVPSLKANRLRLTNLFILAAPGRQAIVAQDPYDNAPIYGCTLIGGSKNIVAAAGRVNGSNLEV